MTGLCGCLQEAVILRAVAGSTHAVVLLAAGNSCRADD
jgi:hypothetical protein